MCGGGGGGGGGLALSNHCTLSPLLLSVKFVLPH